MEPFQSPAVQSAYRALEPACRDALLDLRRLIFDIAKTLPTGPIEESLKWGQPSYKAAGPRAGTPVRLAVTKTGDVAILTHCQTTVISDFRALAPPELRFDGNRALLLDPTHPLPLNAIAPLIRAALTYRV